MKIFVINKSHELFPSMMDLDEFQAILEELKMYNSLLGPIRNVFIMQASSLGLPVYAGVAEHFKIMYALRYYKIKGFIPSSGKSQLLPQAFFGTLGEAIERILPLYVSLKLQKEGRIIYAKVKEMRRRGENILGPEDIHLFSSEQYKDKVFPFKPYTEETFLGWIEGKNLISGEKVYAPAQLMVFGYALAPKESPLGYPSSDGLSCHKDSKHANYHGLCEFVERDCINVRWVCNLPPKQIIIDDLKQIPELFTMYQNTSFILNPFIKTNVYDWSLDLPGIFVISLHCVNLSYTTMKYLPGVGADVCFLDAFNKALREVAQAERTYLVLPLYLRLLKKLPPWMNISPNAKPQEVDNLFKSIVFYGYDKNLRKVEQFLARSKKLYISQMDIAPSSLDIDSKYDILLNAFKERNMRPLSFDLTPPEFKKLKIHKVFVPELTSYFIVYPLLGHPRYYEIGRLLGKIDKRLTFKDFNQSPIPFP